MILGGRLSLGELVQFTGYATMIYGPLGWLMNMPRWIANALISVERVFSVIDEQPEIIDTAKSTKHRIDGTISFKNVTFGYHSYEPVLKSIDLDIKKGNDRTRWSLGIGKIYVYQSHLPLLRCQ